MNRLVSGRELDPEELFPTKGAIPEALQIGRTGAMDEMAKRSAAGDDLLVIERRKDGKSSSIRNGALPRVVDVYGGVVAQIDLRLAGLHDDPVKLAETLAQTAVQTGAGKALTTSQLTALGRATRRFVTGERGQAAAQITGGSAVASTVQALTTIAVGADKPMQPLRQVLEALEREAQDQQRPVVVFIDEVQDLGDEKRWRTHGYDVQLLLEQAMRQDGRLMSFVFSGSDQTAMEKLFAKGMPLYLESERYRLPAIATEDWQVELTARFARDGRRIEPPQLGEILRATDGHPGRTMRVCKATLRLVRAAEAVTITSAMVAQAVSEARNHPSWLQSA